MVEVVMEVVEDFALVMWMQVDVNLGDVNGDGGGRGFGGGRGSGVVGGLVVMMEVVVDLVWWWWWWSGCSGHGDHGGSFIFSSSFDSVKASQCPE